MALLHSSYLFEKKAYPQFPAAELTALSSPAIQRGTCVELQLQGANLESLDQVLISSLGKELIQQSIPQTSNTSSLGPQPFKLSIPEDFATGLFQTRVAGRLGVSNPRALLITSQPVHRVESADHSDSALALEIEGGHIYHFLSQPQQKTYFRISLEAGETLRCVSYAQQLDSSAIPSVTLTGPDLVEVGRGRGIASWPAQICYTAQRSGEHYLIAHDFLYRGGNGFSCLLEAAVDPIKTSSSSSPAEKPSPNDQLELNRLLRPVIRETPQLDHHLQPESALYRDRSHSELAQFTVDEAEPPTAPFACLGNLKSGSFSIDFFASGGKQLQLEVHSSTLDQLTDPRLLLYKLDADEKTGSEAIKRQRLLENDDRPSLGGPDMRLRFRDPYATWKPHADGRYRLVLADQQRGQRPADSMGFQLHVREAVPGFELLAFHEFPHTNRQLARPHGVNLMRSDKTSIGLLAIRKGGWNGAIEVVAENLPEFLECQPAVIPENGSQATLVIESNKDTADWLGNLRIAGHPLQDESAALREASAATISVAATPARNTIATRRTDCLYLASSSLDQAPLSIQAGGANAMEVVQGEKLSIPLSVQRSPEGKVAVLLRPRDLPPKAKLADLNIAADKEQATAELVVARDTPAGVYTIWLQGETRLKWRKDPQALDAAEARLAELRKLADQADTEAEESSSKKGIQLLEKRVEMLRKSSAPRELTTWIPTNLVRVRILPRQEAEP